MRQWASPPDVGAGHRNTGHALAGMIQRLGEGGFEAGVLEALHPLVPAASWSVYRTGPRCRPTLYMSASLGIPDTTRDCWWAYLSGPYLHDRTWNTPGQQGKGGTESIESSMPATQLCHITAQEVGGEHQARVYEAHGMVERVSIFEPESDGALFAVNLYRHQHQRPFSDAQIASFADLAPALLALARKHIALGGPALPRAPAAPVPAMTPVMLREKLQEAHAGLTPRELDVCVRLLQGMTQQGIACDLGLSVPTVKTYRNRAFARLGGIHFRNELFALILKVRPGPSLAAH